MTKHKHPEMLRGTVFFLQDGYWRTLLLMGVWFGFKFIGGGVHCIYFL